MEGFNIIEREIEEMVEIALCNSKTYTDALEFVDRHAPWTEFGNLLKKTIQDKIKQRALDSYILKTEIEKEKSF